MASSVTPPTKEEGTEVDRVVEAEGATVYIWGCLNRSYAKLRLTIAASMTHINEKWEDIG